MNLRCKFQVKEGCARNSWPEVASLAFPPNGFSYFATVCRWCLVVTELQYFYRGQVQVLVPASLERSRAGRGVVNRPRPVTSQRDLSSIAGTGAIAGLAITPGGRVLAFRTRRRQFRSQGQNPLQPAIYVGFGVEPGFLAHCRDNSKTSTIKGSNHIQRLAICFDARLLRRQRACDRVADFEQTRTGSRCFRHAASLAHVGPRLSNGHRRSEARSGLIS
jgi:hypothetical protein